MKSNLLIVLAFLLTSSLAQLPAQNPELFIQTGHTSDITSVGFSSDKKTMVTGAEDNRVLMWDLRTGRQIADLVGHQGDIDNIEMHPNGKYCVSSGDDYFMLVWDVAQRKLHKKVESGKSANDIQFSPDGKYLAVASADHKIRIFSGSSFSLVKTIPVSMGAHELTFSGDGKYLLTNGMKGIRCFSVPGFTQVSILAPDEGKLLRNVSTTKDGKWLLFADESEKKDGFWLQVHSLPDMKPIMEDTLEMIEWFIDQEGNLIHQTFRDDIQVFDGKTFELLKMIKSSRDLDADDIFPGPWPGTISAHDGNEKVLIWDLEANAMIRSFEGKIRQLSAMDVHPKENILALGAIRELPMVINFAEAKAYPPIGPKLDYVGVAKFNPTGDKIHLGTGREELLQADWMNGIIEYRTKLGDDPSKIQYNSGGDKMLVADNFGDIRPQIRNAEDGSLLTEFPVKDREMVTLGWLNDETVVLGGVERMIHYYDASSGAKKATIDPGTNVSRMDISPDKSKIAVTIGRIVRIYNASTKALIKEFNPLPMPGRDAFMCIAFSPDGKYVSAGTTEGRLFSWDVASWKTRKIENAHSGFIGWLDYTPDMKFLVSGSYFGGVKFWSPSTLKYQGVLVNFGANDFILVTPDNYYTATKGALKNVSFRINDLIFPFEQFDLRYNRPDKVIEHFGAADEELIKILNKAYKKRLKREGFTEEMLGNDFHVPELSVTNYSDIPFQTKDPKIKLSLEAADELYTLDRVQVLINDVPVLGPKGIQLRDKKVKSFKEDLEIELENGENRIEVFVRNTKGANSAREEVVINSEKKGIDDPNLYLLTIGVSEFQQADRNLTYASKDANDLSEMYKTSRRTDFDEVYTMTLSNSEATKEKILAASEFLNGARLEDQVIIFFATHGILDSELDYYLATHDMDFNDPAGRGLAYADLDEMVANLKCRNRLLMIDACHSGEVDKDEAELVEEEVKAEEGDIALVFRGGNTTVKPKAGLSNSFEYMKTLFSDMSGESGATVIAAAGGYEFALESDEWNNGVFTYSVIDGLKNKKADIVRGKGIRVSELQEYVGKMVSKLTNGRQVPTSRSENLSRDFLVY